MFTVLAWLSDSVALKVRVTLLGSTKIAYVDALTTLHLDLMRSISAYEKQSASSYTEVPKSSSYEKISDRK